MEAGGSPVRERELHGQRVVFASSERADLLEPGTVDLIVTSPPYWNLKDYGHPGQIGASSYDEYLERLNGVWSTCFEAAKDEAVMVVNVGNRRHEKRFYPIAFDIAERMQGWTLWDIVVWYVPNALPQPNHYIERLLDNKFEFLLIFVKDEALSYTFHKPRVPQKYIDADPRAHKRNTRGRCLGNVIRIPAYRPPNVKALGYHVAAYPEELVALMLESYTDPGDVVLDPFLGSGTTLKVARWMERRGIGIELNEDFGELIERRIEERWEVPDWRDLDILHSSTMEPGMRKPRKMHLLRDEGGEAPAA
ncbi:MAG TPA: site-specific DNA-methyltransferase [Gaiellaceae bacterium]